MIKKRKPTHPGVLLDEDYIKPLNLNEQQLADRLCIAESLLLEVIAGKASVSPSLASALGEEFNTTSQLWVNLQQAYDQS